MAGGTIHAIHPVASPSSSAWESSRSRFIIAGTGGIFKLSLNSIHPLPPVRVDSRPVERPDAITTIDNVQGNPRVVAIAGDDLIAIEQNKVKTLARNITGKCIAWIKEYGELLLITPCDQPGTLSTALVMHADYNAWSSRRLPATTCCYSGTSGARLTSHTENRLYNLNREIGDRCRCIYSRELNITPGDKLSGVAIVEDIILDLTAGTVDGSLSIDAHHGRQPWRTFSRLIVLGEVNRPVKHRVLMPRRLKVRATLDAILSNDTILTSIDHEERR